MPSLTEQLVSLIRARPITDDDRDCAARFLLDSVANALGARNTAPGRMLRGWFAQQGNDAGRQAFLVGGLSHILEMDDLHRASVTHPGCVVVPAALAIGLRTRCSGPALLDAILRGYEAVARIGMAVGPAHYRIWHSTATCGPFGAAMAAADLLGLDDGPDRACPGQCGHAIERPLAVHRDRRHEQASPCRPRRRGRGDGGGAGGARLHRAARDPGRRERPVRRRLPRCRSRCGDTRSRARPGSCGRHRSSPGPAAATPTRPSTRRSSFMAGSAALSRRRSMSRPMARRSRSATGRRRPTNTPPSSRCSIAWPWRWRTGASDLSPSMKRPATGWRR